MANSFFSDYKHIVFSTKHREHWLQPDIMPEVHRYLGGAIKEHGCIPLIVGGVTNHVHILARMKNDLLTKDLVKEIKRTSTNWLNAKGIAWGKFHWQDGYGAFSISYWDVEKIRAYIENQEEHHRRMTWEEELHKLLVKHGVEFDERYYLD